MYNVHVYNVKVSICIRYYTHTHTKTITFQPSFVQLGALPLIEKCLLDTKSIRLISNNQKKRNSLKKG